MNGNGNGNGEQAEATAQKKPYVAPKLRHLGSVRDLTYGTGSGLADFEGGKVPGKG